MLTIHAADLVLPGGGHAPVPGGAVVVRGSLIAAIGPYEDLAAAHPGARTRRWPGLLTPGLVNPYGPELLERAYHPDPREAAELGTEPITGASALAALGMTDARWGASARRGLQRMLAHGTVAVAGDLWRPAVVDAVARAGLSTEQRFHEPPGPPSLDPLADGRPLAEAVLTPLGPAGVDAGFAVFDVRDEAELAARGAGTCVATVLSGRLVFRRR
ncbi:imidazolonepropionase-like domain-containing protein [Streptomyces sp. NPDC085614]|uniref:amidohydrolase family protein n=1 Tax=Streptomyces sp. NPDC085614 TaxID=3365733 RepID=UPI0037CCDF70